MALELVFSCPSWDLGVILDSSNFSLEFSAPEVIRNGQFHLLRSLTIPLPDYTTGAQPVFH